MDDEVPLEGPSWRGARDTFFTFLRLEELLIQSTKMNTFSYLY